LFLSLGRTFKGNPLCSSFSFETILSLFDLHSLFNMDPAILIIVSKGKNTFNAFILRNWILPFSFSFSLNFLPFLFFIFHSICRMKRGKLFRNWITSFLFFTFRILPGHEKEINAMLEFVIFSSSSSSFFLSSFFLSSQSEKKR